MPRGLGLVVRRPRLFLWGALPPLITSIVFLAALVALATQIEPITAWLTPFAAGWSRDLATVVRVLVGAALIGGSVLVMVISFTAITLAVGSPLYDKIAESVEDELGDAPIPTPEPTTTSLARSVRQSVAFIAVSLLGSVALFLTGFVPLVGQLAAPVLSAVFGGWMLCTELIGTAFERRGLLQLSQRRAAMRRNRARVLGFAVPTFLLLAVPFAAVVVFPAAAAAGTLLARDLLANDRHPDRPAARR
nr:EI24 domain-containing protein [Microlunatus panaciterrae]